ncbi:MAG: alpha/beta hydrolase [Labrys sp. (in: a-proteobacteria)]
MTRLDGPRLAPLSGTAKQLVVFLHGYGADGNDLIDLGKAWQSLVPDAAFVSPHAPEPCGGAPYGRQWFGLTFRDPHERWRGVEAARPVLDAFLDEELDRLGLDGGSLVLVGFSQGAMMSLHVGPRRAVQPAGILAFSGVLVAPEGQQPAVMKPEIRSRPPVFLVHGDQDQVIPHEALFFSFQGLASLDIPVTFHVSRGLGHGIDQEGLAFGGAFVQRSFG